MSKGGKLTLPEVLGDHLLFGTDCQQLTDGSDFGTVRSQCGITVVTKSRLYPTVFDLHPPLVTLAVEKDSFPEPSEFFCGV